MNGSAQAIEYSREGMVPHSVHEGMHDGSSPMSGEMFPLLQRLRRKEGAALDEVIRLYGRGLTRAAYLFLGEAHAAEDAVQETLIAVWDGAHKVKDADALRPWLYGVLFNRCRKRRWRNLLARRHEHAAAQARDQSGIRRGDAAGDDSYEKLAAALAALEPGLRALIVLRFERDFSVAETAQALGIPEGTVKSRTHTAIETLRQRLNPGAQAS